MVKLRTPAAGGPYTLTFKGDNTVTVSNVLSGDVWPCSGQSNMAMQVQKCANAEEEIKAGNYPLIRDFKIRINPTMTVAKDVGKRMASTILNKTYGKGTPTSPLMVKSETVGHKVVLHFEYAGSGLMAKGGKLASFAIAGADKNFVWADAVIENRDGRDVVVVSSPEVKNPASVRYAWALNPIKANLYSKEGFPASPFRTDNWAYGLQ